MTWSFNLILCQILTVLSYFFNLNNVIGNFSAPYLGVQAEPTECEKGRFWNDRKLEQGSGGFGLRITHPYLDINLGYIPGVHYQGEFKSSRYKIRKNDRLASCRWGPTTAYGVGVVRWRSLSTYVGSSVRVKAVTYRRKICRKYIWIAIPKDYCTYLFLTFYLAEDE